MCKFTKSASGHPDHRVGVLRLDETDSEGPDSFDSGNDRDHGHCIGSQGDRDSDGTQDCNDPGA